MKKQIRCDICGSTWHYTSMCPQKRKPIKSKRKTKPAYGFKNQVELFKHIWETREHVCYVSGKPLNEFEGTDKFVNLFAHVLPKGLYGRYRLNPDNIVLLHPDVHYLFDFGTEEQRIESGHNFGILYELQANLKKEYNT